MEPSSDQNKNKGDIFKQIDDPGGEQRRRKMRYIKDSSYRCEFCANRYFSLLVLSTHLIHEHNICKAYRSEGEGEENNNSNESAVFYPLNRTYFNSQHRKGTVTEFKEPIVKAYEDLFTKIPHEVLQIKKIQACAHINEHPFLNLYLHDAHDLTKEIGNGNEICDVVFMEYLNRMSVHVNPAYFSKLIIFVTLYWECVNGKYKNQCANNQKYTAVYCANDVPYLSNYFINYFINPESNVFCFTEDEAIELTQNLCAWMNDNNFTCYQLFVIAKKENQ